MGYRATNSSGRDCRAILVHIPVYASNTPSMAGLILHREAGTGGVFANLYPEKADAPYLLAGGMTRGWMPGTGPDYRAAVNEQWKRLPAWGSVQV
jgi:hypothetical protein